jgi:hypothetical protein
MLGVIEDLRECFPDYLEGLWMANRQIQPMLLLAFFFVYIRDRFRGPIISCANVLLANMAMKFLAVADERNVDGRRCVTKRAVHRAPLDCSCTITYSNL